MRAAGTLLGAAVLAVILAACGNGSASPHRQGVSEWQANAAGVVTQLRADTVSALDGANLGAARAALHDESRLYGLLVAYSDFGGCRHMASALGEPPDGLGDAAVTLGHACASLQRAAALFTRAAANSDPRSLVAAARAVQDAGPLLVRAQFELHASSSHGQ
jgi:hypothetical protein